MIRGVLIQSSSAGAKNFTKYVFFHLQFNGVVQKSQNHCAISVKFKKKRFFYSFKFISLVIICIDNKGQNGTTIFNILDNTTELWMTKYIIGEIFSSGGATLYKNPSDQTVQGLNHDDMEFLKSHTCYDEKTIKQWYKGFRKDCPDGQLTKVVLIYFRTLRK